MFWFSDIKNIFLKNKNIFIILIKQIFNVYKERKKKSILCFFIYYLGNVEKIENERNKIKKLSLVSYLCYAVEIKNALFKIWSSWKCFFGSQRKHNC
jgi:hypothetical protein